MPPKKDYFIFSQKQLEVSLELPPRKDTIRTFIDYDGRQIAYTEWNNHAKSNFPDATIVGTFDKSPKIVFVPLHQYKADRTKYSKESQSLMPALRQTLGSRLKFSNGSETQPE